MEVVDPDQRLVDLIRERLDEELANIGIPFNGITQDRHVRSVFSNEPVERPPLDRFEREEQQWSMRMLPGRRTGIAGAMEPTCLA